MKTLFAICHLSFAIAVAAAAQQQLWFTPSPDTNAAGTFVYGSTNATDFATPNSPATFALKQDAGTNNTVVMTNVTAGCTWYWTATAYAVQPDGSNVLESVHCNIVLTCRPLPPGSLRPRK